MGKGGSNEWKWQRWKRKVASRTSLSSRLSSPPTYISPPLHLLRYSPFFVSTIRAPSLFPSLSFLACCGYKRGVDYKIMKIYGSSLPPQSMVPRDGRIEREGYAICRAFMELCSRLLMKMAEQQWQLPGALSRFAIPAPISLYRFLSLLSPRQPSLQVFFLPPLFPSYRCDCIDPRGFDQRFLFLLQREISKKLHFDPIFFKLSLSKFRRIFFLI